VIGDALVAGRISPRGVKLIKVFVRADSPSDLARLTALVKSAPSLRLIGTSLHSAEAGGQISEFAPDVLLESGGFDDSEEISLAEFEPKSVARVLIVSETEFSAVAEAMRASDSAIRGILPDYASDAEIQSAIESAAAGLHVFHPDVLDHILENTGGGMARASNSISAALTEQPAQPLSPREGEILNLLAQGLANKEIAWRLKISEHTVKFHITSIFNKLNASTRAEAVAIGIRQGLIIL
jgi:DNA-binding NarL/FixJ family response regulator